MEDLQVLVSVHIPLMVIRGNLVHEPYLSSCNVWKLKKALKAQQLEIGQ